VHLFGVDALDDGVPTSEVMPAVIQMLEGWMLARDAGAFDTTYMGLDAAVTLLERRLSKVREQRDQLIILSEALLAERKSGSGKRGRDKGRRGKRQREEG
jgi:hypothetical protein